MQPGALVDVDAALARRGADGGVDPPAVGDGRQFGRQRGIDRRGEVGIARGDEAGRMRHRVAQGAGALGERRGDRQHPAPRQRRLGRLPDPFPALGGADQRARIARVDRQRPRQRRPFAVVVAQHSPRPRQVHP